MNENCIEREYFCRQCIMTYSVVHSNKTNRTTNCEYCACELFETGRTREIEGKFVIIKQGGKEIERHTDKRSIGNKL